MSNEVPREGEGDEVKTLINLKVVSACAPKTSGNLAQEAERRYSLAYKCRVLSLIADIACKPCKRPVDGPSHPLSGVLRPLPGFSTIVMINPSSEPDIFNRYTYGSHKLVLTAFACKLTCCKLSHRKLVYRDENGLKTGFTSTTAPAEALTVPKR